MLYFGFRNGKVGYYTEKWEGVDSGNNKNISKYEGEIKNGLPNGQGILTFPDGEKYVGEYKDGERNGQGTYTWNDGGKYVGEYKDGLKNGQGKFTFHDGWKFEGIINHYTAEVKFFMCNLQGKVELRSFLYKLNLF